jgi:hypothetical protein
MAIFTALSRTTQGLSSGAWKTIGPALLVINSLATPSALRADLYGHWPLDDGSGDVARNEVPGGYEGFIHDWDVGGLGEDGSVWVNDPDRGTVLGVNGTTAWVDAGFIPIMDLENTFSWAFWSRVPPEQPSPNNDIVLGNRWGVNGSDTSPREFIKFTTNRFEYHMNGGFGDDLAYADSNLPLDQWVYNSIVKDGDSLTYYRDGEFRNSTTISGGQSSGDPLPLGFGGDVGSSGGEAWQGYLSDVQTYTSALTPAQIETAMTGTTVADADLYAHYPMDEGNDAFILEGTGPGAVDAFISDEFAGLGPDGSVWVDDPERGTVLSFAGAYVDAGDLPLMTLENDFTWTFWSRSDAGQAQTSNTIIIGNRNDFGGTDTGEWIKFTNDRIEFHADGTADSDLEWGDAGPDDIRMPNDDQWYHHVVVKDGDEMKYYRDGVAKNEVTLGLAQQTAEELPFAMGGQAAPGNSAGEPSEVYLSDVRLYDHPLSPQEIAELAGISLEVPGDCNGDGVVDATDLDCVHLIAPDTSDRDAVLAALGTVLGDLDGDGTVGFGDFVTLSNNYGDVASVKYTQGDIDLEGGPQFSDFVILSNNYGQGAAAAVPEPSGLALIGLGGLLLGLARRRRP